MKVGIRRFWKVRRVTEHRQFIKRVDVRMKVALPVKYMQDTWALNFRRRDRSGAGRDYGYFQRRSCNLYEPLV